jgi:uncharacterized protein with HEPN domain
MDLEVKKFLQDILDSISLIENYLQSLSSLADYQNDLKSIDAVERRLAIIGEALWQANKVDSSIDVTEKSKIISLRHILVHNYDLVDDSTIWMICKKHIPLLKDEVSALLFERK